MTKQGPVRLAAIFGLHGVRYGVPYSLTSGAEIKAQVFRLLIRP